MQWLHGIPNDRYEWILLLLLLSLLLFGFSDSPVIRVVVLSLQIATLLFTLATSDVGVLPLKVALAAAVAIVVLAVAASFAETDPRVLFSVLWALLVAPALFAILKRLARHRVVTARTVMGAVSAYLLIGLLATYTFLLVGGIASQPFFTSEPAASPFDFLYFSYVTLTTLGYGDFTSALDIGRAVAMTEALIGQIFLVTMVARLVSLWTKSPRRSEIS